jgi:DNA primase
MAGAFDYAAVNRVQQANDIVDVVGEHVSLKRKGREWVGLCPFHEDHRPSMYVNPSKQIFKCFACGAGGDVLKFVQMREGLTFPQAVERLAERAGIEIRRTRPRASQASRPDGVDPNRLAKLNAWATQFFQACLNDPEDGRVARDYLASRQISAESIAKFRLGVAPMRPDALMKAAAARKIPPNLLQQGGLTTSAGQGRFANRLMFSITDVTGRVIGFGGRTLDGTGAKYINSPATPLFDKGNTLYGLEQARHEIVKTGTAVVVEGYTDVIMAHQFGCGNVVATLGTSFTNGHGRMLRRYAKTVVLVFDNDTAGVEAANRALEVCLAQRLDIRVAFVSEGKDPCEFLLAAGKEAFDRMVRQATDVLQFKWDRLSEVFAADDTLVGRRAVLNDFLQAVATGLASNNLPVIESGLIINRLSKIIGLSAREITAELNRSANRISRVVRSEPERHVSETVDWGQGLYAAAQREVLEVLLNAPELLNDMGEDISVRFFDVPVLKSIASLVLDAIAAPEPFSINAVLARTESVRLGECIVELQRVGEQKGNYRARLADALGLLSRHRLGATDRSEDSTGSGVTSKKSFGTRNPHSLGMT